jgi:hypothetical protein
MVTRLLLISAAAVVAVSCITVIEACAAWVDPPPFEPPQTAKPVQPAPLPAPAPPLPAPQAGKPVEQPPPSAAEAPPPQVPRSAAAPTEDPSETEQQVAEHLFADYLSYWSGVSMVSPEDVGRYYSFPIQFYGRRIVSPDELISEKRRFILRWPERDYSAVPGTLRSSCDSDAPICQVSGLFSFSANDPRRGRSSAGTGQLELGVLVDGSSGKIISENSRVVSRDRQQGDDGDEF